MGQNLDEIVADLPKERQERVRARYLELKQEVEGLRELRRLAGTACPDNARAVQPGYIERRRQVQATDQ